MDRTVAAFYNNGVAHYKIISQKNGSFIARLLNFQGRSGPNPPKEFELQKVGHRWKDDDADPDLVNDLGRAIEQENSL